jgi:hypothetical protein
LGNSMCSFLLAQWQKVFLAILVPVLTYGIQVWFTDKRQSGLLKILDVTQNKACCKAAGVFCTTPTQFVTTLLRIPPITYRLCHLLRSATTRLSRLPPSATLCNPESTCKVTGIPCHTVTPPMLPPSDRTELLPYQLPPHPSPAWSHPCFSLFTKPHKKPSHSLSYTTLRHNTLDTIKILIKTTPSSQHGRHLGLFAIFISNLVHSSGYIMYDLACSTEMLTLLEALQHSLPRLQVRIFFQDAIFHTYFTIPSPPSLFLPVTQAIEDYLATSPSSRIVGFWANLSWSWPSLESWSDVTSSLHNDKFHTTLLCNHSSNQRLSSKDQMFQEWENNFQPPPPNDPHHHYPVLADPPCIELHPFTKGVLSAQSHRLQAAAFQLATRHCFSAEYSTWFRSSARDQTNCPRCGDLFTPTHVLEDSACYVIERQEGGLDTLTLAHLFTSFSGGKQLVKFLHINQVFLCPLDLIPPAIPPEPDP